MDIIVTTPKSQMAAAAQEAADARAAGGATEYFRCFPRAYAPWRLRVGDRVYYVEDGLVRGYAVVSHIKHSVYPIKCTTTGREWPAGFYAFMRADSWRWIRPIPMKGFRGFRYVDFLLYGTHKKRDLLTVSGQRIKEVYGPVVEVGGWLDPRPRSCRVCGCTDRHGCPPPRGPCSWIEADLCSACRPLAKEKRMTPHDPSRPDDPGNSSSEGTAMRSYVTSTPAPPLPRPCRECGSDRGEGYGCYTCAAVRLMKPRRQVRREVSGGTTPPAGVAPIVVVGRTPPAKLEALRTALAEGMNCSAAARLAELPIGTAYAIARDHGWLEKREVRLARRDPEILRRIRAGQPYGQIADACGCSRFVVSAVARQHGAPRRPPGHVERAHADRPRVLALLQKGRTILEVHRQTGRSRGFIQKIASEENIRPPRSRTGPHALVPADIRASAERLLRAGCSVNDARRTTGLAVGTLSRIADRAGIPRKRRPQVSSVERERIVAMLRGSTLEATAQASGRSVATVKRIARLAGIVLRRGRRLKEKTA